MFAWFLGRDQWIAQIQGWSVYLPFMRAMRHAGRRHGGVMGQWYAGGAVTFDAVIYARFTLRGAVALWGINGRVTIDRLDAF